MVGFFTGIALATYYYENKVKKHSAKAYSEGYLVGLELKKKSDKMFK